MHLTFAVFLFLLGTPLRAAENNAPPPGEYDTQNGTLDIERANGKTTFHIVSVNPENGHTCEIEGEIHGHAATVSTVDPASGHSTCVVTFGTTSEGIKVDSDGDACQESCGAGMQFDDTYMKPAPECTGAALKETRRKFSSAYAAKDYSGALQRLQPLLARCGDARNPADVDALRNDIAITQYHLHDLAGCLETLAPLRDEAAKSDEQLEAEYSLFMMQNRRASIHAARTNLRLCGGLPH
jgi:hypothetical protein